VGKPPTDEQEQLVTLFNTLETQQLEFLDQAGKRIIELSTGLLGILFAVIALGDKFPPTYLQGNLPAKGLTVAAVVLYLVALVVAVLGIQPRDYQRYRHNLSKMRDELTRMVNYKARWVKVAAMLFVLATLSLTGLLALLVWSA
jgi:hypothetical protein